MVEKSLLEEETLALALQENMQRAVYDYGFRCVVSSFSQIYLETTV
jgi:hypothetical protein